MFVLCKKKCGVLQEKVFLEIFQNSQEITCAWVLFLMKLQAIGSACNFIKKETLVQDFSCELSEIFKNTIFTEHFRNTASGCAIKHPAIVFV